jgi:hypothetical protein
LLQPRALCSRPLQLLDPTAEALVCVTVDTRLLLLLLLLLATLLLH